MDTEPVINIQVQYTCSMCGLFGISVDVKARGDEDVVMWLDNNVRPAITADHTARSPHCPANKLDELKIPVSGVNRIGDAPQN